MDKDYKNIDITDASNFATYDDDAIIKVIGVGGGGGNAVNYMYEQNIPYVNFVVCNTDRQALDLSPVPNKLVLGYDITHGRGAGNNPDIGRQCAESSEEDIKKLFDDQTEMVFITAGMGGGTGTGAGPVVARIAKEAGMLTIGIVTVPFMFEGKKKIQKALEGAQEMRKYVDAMLIINNENLVELYKDYNIFNAFEKADDTLANAARSISEIISERCFINVDFQDVKTTLKDSGTAIISTAYGEGEHRISDAINKALHSPLLKKHDIKSSKRLLFKFTISRQSSNPIQASEINDITQFTSNLPPTIDVKWGIADNPELGDKVKVTVLASGFDITLRDAKESGEEKTTIFSAEKPEEKDKIDFGQSDNDTDSREGTINIADIYDNEQIQRQRRIADKQRYTILKPEQFDDMEVITLLERHPTFNRESHFNDYLNNLNSFDAGNDKKENTGGGETIMFGDIKD